MRKQLWRVAGVFSMAAIGAAVLVPLGAGEAPAREPETKVLSDIAYYEGPDADPVRHKLDVYLPAGKKDFPVFFFVHGGAWIHGNKNQFGMYGALARTFTRHGIGMVSTNYRLSPAVSHPEHIKDVARAFAWTQRNIARYGGRPQELFVGGHSAGGHLSALLATDEQYLKAEGLGTSTIRGALPLSGVFTIPDIAGLKMVFGQDPAQRRAASPIAHARPGLPPFLIIYADSDLPVCDRPGAEAFCRALRRENCRAETIEVPKRNHVTILLNAVRDTDPVAQAMVGFIQAQVAAERMCRDGCGGVDYLLSCLGQ